MNHKLSLAEMVTMGTLGGTVFLIICAMGLFFSLTAQTKPYQWTSFMTQPPVIVQSVPLSTQTKTWPAVFTPTPSAIANLLEPTATATRVVDPLIYTTFNQVNSQLNLADVVFIEGIPQGKQTRNLSCESRSAVDLAGYYGFNLSEPQFFNTLPKSDNPHTGFVGNVDDSPGSLPPQGYGVYAEPVARTLKQFGICSKSHYYFGLETLKNHLATGQPVIVWATYNLLHKPTQEYRSTDGLVSEVIPYEHTFIAIGYDENGFYLLDPWDGQVKHYDYEAFNSSWKRFKQMAVTICESVSAIQ